MNKVLSELPKQFQYAIEKMKAAPLQQEPFPHILIEGLLPESEYQKLLEEIPDSDAFSQVSYPGVGVDIQAQRRVNHGLALNDLTQFSALGELNQFMKSQAFSQLLLERFTAPDSWEGHNRTAIPEEKHIHFKNGSNNHATVLDLHKDLPGYEIYPHRDIDLKIITFLYYLEPDDAVADWGTLLCQPKEGLSLDDVENAEPPHEHPKWRDWVLFDVVKVARATPNTLLVFAPNFASYHAVKMDIPKNHIRRERTAIRGFIRTGSNTSNWIKPYKSVFDTQHLYSLAREKPKLIARKVNSKSEQAGIVQKRFDVIVASYGGAGTTMLLDFLAKHTKVNNLNSFVDGIKHIDTPNHPVLNHYQVRRAIYLVSDPRLAALSLFRRGYAQPMMAKLKSRHTTVEEYKRIAKENQPNVKDLADFLAQGEDLFGFKSHWQQWKEDASPFPVLFVNYDALHDSIDQILDFLGLPASLKGSFPPREHRASKLDQLSEEERTRLDTIYKDLADEIAEAPELFIRSETI